MGHRLQESGVFEAAMVDSYEEPKQPQPSPEDDDQGMADEMINQVEVKPFAERLRMIIALSLICWALVIAAVVLIAG